MSKYLPDTFPPGTKFIDIDDRPVLLPADGGLAVSYALNPPRHTDGLGSLVRSEGVCISEAAFRALVHKYHSKA